MDVTELQCIVCGWFKGHEPGCEADLDYERHPIARPGDPGWPVEPITTPKEGQ